MLRFSIRDLLWLMVVVGILAAWRNDHRRVNGSVLHLEQVIREYDAEKLDLEAKAQSLDQRLGELNASANDFKAFQDERWRRYLESRSSAILDRP